MLLGEKKCKESLEQRQFSNQQKNKAWKLGFGVENCCEREKKRGSGEQHMSIQKPSPQNQYHHHYHYHHN